MMFSIILNRVTQIGEIFPSFIRLPKHNYSLEQEEISIKNECVGSSIVYACDVLKLDLVDK